MKGTKVWQIVQKERIRYVHPLFYYLDDGSTDNSTVIALEYAQKYPKKIRYLEHENHQNLGMSASRNWGIDHAQGEYIAFLDSDDVWLSHKLERQVAILESEPEAAMVYGWVQIWYSWTGNPEDSQRDYFMELRVPPNTLIQPPKLLINILTDRDQRVGASNLMIRQEVFKKFGRFEENFREWGEDYIFFIKGSLNVSIFVSGECWVKYRKHENSTTATLENSQKFSDFKDVLNWVEKYFMEQGMKDHEVWRTFQKLRFPYRSPVLYFLWRGYLELAISIGRQILPVRFRHWLWINIVSKLYQIKIEKPIQ
ncbi:glycosyltransferase family 2 protein [Nodularia harveyana UHCC-0300]|uniref:Glycosyltransferase family 2 protein n=1 Tax=Nodularia harveyana UHCC-0300 TaxID=2974287 RepID=A0ABU5UBB2_9CYAN|nr:glycosyltransferase family 2 protein [Nodularia harveyana]MEA5580236.1 glycosyltransferase family 2 protein [Nodularia harveyana UHCC-0300]